MNEEIDLKDIISKNNKEYKYKYKLIGFITETIEENIKIVISHSKSLDYNIWYQYKNWKNDNKGTNFNYIKNNDNYIIPNLLIYEKI